MGLRSRDVRYFFVMKFFQSKATVLVPDGLAEPEALRRVTHLGISLLNMAVTITQNYLICQII